MTTRRYRAHERHTLCCLASLTGLGDPRPRICVVRDVSLEGALIEVGAVDTVPAVFRLAVAGMGMSRVCSVVRRTDGMVGVTFIDVPAR